MPQISNSQRSAHLRGLFLAITGILILTPDSLLVRLISADHWTLLFWRGLMTSITLSLFLLYTHGSNALAQFRNCGVTGLVIALLFALNTTLFVISIRHTAVANTLVLLSMAPLFAALFSTFFLGERTPLRTWIATLIGILSIGYIMLEGVGGSSLIGDGAALLLALTMAALLTMLRARRSNDVEPIIICSGLMLAILLVPFADPFSLDDNDWIYMSLLGLFVIPVSFALTLRAPRYLPAPEVGLLYLLETLLGPSLVWLVIGEEPPSSTLLGGVVLVSTLVVHALVSLHKSSNRRD